MRTCSIPDCGKRHEARGWCEAHYGRWRRHGDPLGDKPCTSPGEPLRFLREVVLPYDGDECLVWPFSLTTSGYARIKVGGRNTGVPRLVCERVYGPPPTPKHDAAHSCGRGHEGCCTKRHLRWATKVENEADKIAHGTSNRGERNPRAKLTEADVRCIRALKGTMLQREIAAQFGVSQSIIGRIHGGKRWA